MAGTTACPRRVRAQSVNRHARPCGIGGRCPAARQATRQRDRLVSVALQAGHRDPFTSSSRAIATARTGDQTAVRSAELGAEHAL